MYKNKITNEMVENTIDSFFLDFLALEVNNIKIKYLHDTGLKKNRKYNIFIIFIPLFLTLTHRTNCINYNVSLQCIRSFEANWSSAIATLCYAREKLCSKSFFKDFQIFTVKCTNT